MALWLYSQLNNVTALHLMWFPVSYNIFFSIDELLNNWNIHQDSLPVVLEIHSEGIIVTDGYCSTAYCSLPSNVALISVTAAIPRCDYSNAGHLEVAAQCDQLIRTMFQGVQRLRLVRLKTV